MSTKIPNSHVQILIVFYHGTYMHPCQIYIQIFNNKLIIDMYTCTCTTGRQKEYLVFCLTCIQSFKLVGTHEHDKVVIHVSILSDLVFDKMYLHSMHGH